MMDTLETKLESRVSSKVSRTVRKGVGGKVPQKRQLACFLLYTTPTGTSVTNFGLAVNERRGSGENRRETTCFIEITCFGRQAETADQYLGKGHLVLIEGRLDFQRWEKDGETRSQHKVIANKVTFMPRATAGAPAGASDRQYNLTPDNSWDETPADHDDLPF